MGSKALEKTTPSLSLPSRAAQPSQGPSRPTTFPRGLRSRPAHGHPSPSPPFSTSGPALSPSTTARHQGPQHPTGPAPPPLLHPCVLLSFFFGQAQRSPLGHTAHERAQPVGPCAGRLHQNPREEHAPRNHAATALSQAAPRCPYMVPGDACRVSNCGHGRQDGL